MKHGTGGVDVHGPEVHLNGPGPRGPLCHKDPVKGRQGPTGRRGTRDGSRTLVRPTPPVIPEDVATKSETWWHQRRGGGTPEPSETSIQVPVVRPVRRGDQRTKGQTTGR